MGKVRKLSSGKYQVDYNDAAGVRHRPEFAKKKDADAFNDGVAHRRYTGTAIDESLGKKLVEQYAWQWWEQQPNSPTHDLNVRSHLRNHILPVIGKKQMMTVTPSDIQAIVTSSSGRLSPNSLRTMMATCGKMFRSAVRARAIMGNPCLHLDLPKVTLEEVIPLGKGQIDRIVDELPARYKVPVKFTAKTGVRQGELFGVAVSDIEWDDEPEVRIRRQVQSYTGNKKTIMELKNRAHRTVPLTKLMIRELEEHLAEFPPVGHDHLFTNTKGEFLHRRIFERHWMRARIAAAAKLEGELEEKFVGNPVGLIKAMPAVSEIREAHFHGLRHYFASLLIRGGQSVPDVSRLLGHANPQMTLRVYAHLWHDHGSRTRATIENWHEGI